jgi:hypothetical protein
LLGRWSFCPTWTFGPPISERTSPTVVGDTPTLSAIARSTGRWPFCGISAFGPSRCVRPEGVPFGKLFHLERSSQWWVILRNFRILTHLRPSCCDRLIVDADLVRDRATLRVHHAARRRRAGCRGLF